MTSLVVHLERLTNARTVEELWDVHTRQMSTYGFDRLMYGFTRYRTSTGLGDPQDWVLLSTQSPEYMKNFIDEGLYYHAPMIRWALANDGACSENAPRCWVNRIPEQDDCSDHRDGHADHTIAIACTAGGWAGEPAQGQNKQDA